MWKHYSCLTFLLLAVLTMNFSCDAIVCYKCDSMTLAACSMSLDETELPYEECKTSLQCVMSIVDAVTYRGCSSNTPTVAATYKKSCRDNLCNRGVYPPGRLKCHHCSGADCVAARENKPHPCRDHYELDQCYTQVLTPNEAYRGCQSDANHTVASATEYCDINGCNERAGASRLTCAHCDSQQGRGCKMNLFEVYASNCSISQYETCEVDTMLLRPETCFLYHNLERVVRGCTKYMPDDVRADEHLAEHLQECAGGDLCNAKCLPQQKCLICDSTISAACRTDASMIANNVCGSAEDSSCYACEYEDWQVRRGCGAAPQNADTTRCYECADVARCNDVAFTRCYKCSSAMNPNCASWERPGYDIEIEECMQPNAACIVAALPSQGLTLRGCESDYLQCNATVSSCSACQGSFCNKGAFPPHRLRCYQCAADESADCGVVDHYDPLPCLTLDLEPLQQNEACFEYYDAQRGGMVRGCRSDFAQYFRCLRQQDVVGGGVACHICLEDGCNRSPATQPPNMQCYECARSSLNCQLDQKASGYLKFCELPVPFGYNESCFLTQQIDGTVSRGCTLDQTLSDSVEHAWDQTTQCTTDGCNFVPTIAQYCFACQSYLTSNEPCVAQIGLLEARLCTNSSGALGCFTLVAGDQISRGCTTELLPNQFESCQYSTESNCKLCQGQCCNVYQGFNTILPAVYKDGGQTLNSSY